MTCKYCEVRHLKEECKEITYDMEDSPMDLISNILSANTLKAINEQGRDFLSSQDIKWDAEIDD